MAARKSLFARALEDNARIRDAKASESTSGTEHLCATDQVSQVLMYSKDQTAALRSSLRPSSVTVRLMAYADWSPIPGEKSKAMPSPVLEGGGRGEG